MIAQGPVPPDDDSIEGQEKCYRRVHPRQAVPNDNKGGLWPSSAALIPASDDTEVSIYLGSLLDALGLEPEDTLEGHDGFGLCTFPASAAREAGFGVMRDPVLASDRPLKVDGAHAVLTGAPATGKPAVKRARRLVLHDAFDLIIPPRSAAI